MRKVLALGAAAALTLSLSVVALGGNGTPINTGSANKLTLAVYGDAPYGTSPTDTEELKATPAFIDSINSDPKVDLVVHVGDIHSGKQYCTETYDRQVFDLWTRFKDPLLYTPGDNEWADCHKAAERGGPADANGDTLSYAGGNPITNLGLVRSIFFPRPGVSLGGRPKQVLSQADNYDPAHPADAAFVENVMWEQSKALFVTVNIPGGSNNDTDPWFGSAETPAQAAQQAAEVSARTDADLRWLDAAFAQAAADQVSGVVIITQADMWDTEVGKVHTNEEPFVSNIAGHTKALAKPVLLFNGDSHVYRSDNPLSASDPLNALHPGYDVPNFHRVVVHGSTFPLEWLRLTVDPKAGVDPATANAFGPFSWQQVVQP